MNTAADTLRKGSHPSGVIDLSLDRDLIRRVLVQVPHPFTSAFAVRCARRVAPLVLNSDNREAIEWLDHLDSALGVFALWAQGESISRFRLEQARGDCSAVKNATDGDAAYAADFAATAADFVAATAPSSTTATSAADTAYLASADTASSVRADIDRLREVQSTDGWHDEYSVPADFFGPLWVGDEPEWSREGWAKLRAYREQKANPKSPPSEPGTTLEQWEGWFAELERLRAERLPYPSYEERLADTNWYFEQLNARKMGDYSGRFIAILRGEVVGTDTDATRLELAMAHKFLDINPDRFVIVHVS